MHRRPAEEGIAAHAKARGEFDFADHRLAVGHQRQRPVQPLHLEARDIDAIELALEGGGIGRQLDRHERTADGRAGSSRLELRHVETEIVDHAAHAADAGFHAVFDRT